MTGIFCEDRPETADRSARREAMTLALAILLLAGSRGASATEPQPTVDHKRDMNEAAASSEPDDLHRPWLVTPELSLPYPLDNLMRGWSPCAFKGAHRGLDIGAVGPQAGLGTPVRAIARAEVIEIGTSADAPHRCGVPLTEAATVRRGGVELPASLEVPPYGRVHFFTRDHGALRTGTFVRLRVLDGSLARSTVIYMHLAAVHPDLRVGATVAAGDELGLLGGTAVQYDPPHLHFEVRAPNGAALDPGRVLGFGPTSIYCHGAESTRNAQRLRFQREADALMARLRSAPETGATKRDGGGQLTDL